MIEKIGLLAAIMLPFWNIPLIVRIGRRKSSKDVSLAWAIGVWVCLVGMLPSGLQSPDPIFQVFTLINITFFTGVLIQILRYRT